MGGMRLGKRQDTNDQQPQIDNGIKTSELSRPSSILYYNNAVERLIAALDEERLRRDRVLDLSNRIINLYKDNQPEDTTMAPQPLEQSETPANIRYLANDDSLLSKLQEIRNRQYNKFASGRL